jgi:antitoxin (DNA-binding transcriptional repressor) of toxin-antitoxin stability system
MKTTSVRELRNNFAKVSRWMEAGEEVQITKRGVPYAKIEILESPRKRRRRFDPKEHRKWMEKTFGGKTLPGNSVLLMREGAKW